LYVTSTADGQGPSRQMDHFGKPGFPEKESGKGDLVSRELGTAHRGRGGTSSEKGDQKDCSWGLCVANAAWDVLDPDVENRSAVKGGFGLGGGGTAPRENLVGTREGCSAVSRESVARAMRRRPKPDVNWEEGTTLERWWFLICSMGKKGINVRLEHDGRREPDTIGGDLVR